jgi:hypothetical protein
MKKLLTVSLLTIALPFSAFAGGPARTPLAALLGHWQGSAKFYDTKYSKAQSITSTADCAWTPQGAALVCETLIEDVRGKHVQLSIDTPDAEGSGYTYYTITPGQKPFIGEVVIDGNSWTYNPRPDAAKSYPVFRTTNAFSGDIETFKTEFTDDGSHWTMIAGAQHRVTTK